MSHRTPPTPPTAAFADTLPPELSESLAELIPSLRQSFTSIVEACDLYDQLAEAPSTKRWSLPRARARLQHPDATISERQRALTALSLNPRPRAGTLLNWWADDAPDAGPVAHFALVARLEWERQFDPGPKPPPP